MKLQQSLQLVPRAIRIAAAVIFVCALPVGLLVGRLVSHGHNRFHTLPFAGLAALGMGAVVAVWLLAIGFVYADARRRSMRAVPWVLVAIFVPHLLGFLFYFVMRQPIPSFCSHCGGTVFGGQRFCSTCGEIQAPFITAQPLPPGGQNVAGAD